MLGALAAPKEPEALAVLEVVVALGVPPAPTIPRASKYAETRVGAWRRSFEGNPGSDFSPDKKRILF